MRKNRRITPEGTRDLLFEECLARREVEDRLSIQGVAALQQLIGGHDPRHRILRCGAGR